MSAVFLAREVEFDRPVVIKLLPRELADADAAERFRREIALVAHLQHPQIVPLLAAGECEGLPWFAMPYVDGESLSQRLRRGPLSIRESVSILIDVCRALSLAHEQGVVHRDIKPGNILLTKTSAVVSDFGVAKAVASARHRLPVTATDLPSGATVEGMSLGTPAYMAPEQVVGRSRDGLPRRPLLAGRGRVRDARRLSPVCGRPAAQAAGGATDPAAGAAVDASRRHSRRTRGGGPGVPGEGSERASALGARRDAHAAESRRDQQRPATSWRTRA